MAGAGCGQDQGDQEQITDEGAPRQTPGHRPSAATMRYTISQIAKKFGLSRSSLLYYDSIGLLSPKKRTGANYRLYSGSDLLVMEEIARLQNAGVSLKEIRRVIHTKPSQRGATLRRRLADIIEEMRRLRAQQRFIIDLLGDREINSSRVLTKEKWIACLKKAGLDEEGMKRWHEEFEASSPAAHQDFLESLGIDDEEISAIRKRSR
jgi:MerR family transcriptional regulator, thiopeptide resistance regulator